MNELKYMIVPGFTGIRVQMRIFGIFWVTVKKYNTGDAELDYILAEELMEKLIEK